MRGEGWDGGGHRGSSPPHLNPPPPWGEEVIFLTQLGYYIAGKPRPYVGEELPICHLVLASIRS